jgi:AraC-like DNA-binding protein
VRGMAEAPEELTRCPVARGNMSKWIAGFGHGDVATELLRDFRVDSSVLCRSLMAPPWGFGVEGRDVGSFHMVLEGQGWLEVEGRMDPIRLERGDLVILPKGDGHRVTHDAGASAPLLTAILSQHDVIDGELRFGGDVGPVTEIVCGIFGSERFGTAPWVRLLPDVIHSTRWSSSDGWRGGVAAALRSEARDPTPGGAIVVNRLLESMLVDVIRVEIAKIDRDGASRGSALADHRIGRVLAEVHAAPDAPWSVGRLAERASMSRSAFSERFRAVVGQPPMRYLMELRLTRAARSLRTSDATLAEVARSAGYGSEASFSRAFKNRFHQSPGGFRRTSSAE